MLNIQKTKIMTSSPITSWQIDGETVETVTDFIFWGSKITDGSEKPGKLEVGGASRDPTGFGALEEGLISS